MQNADILTGPMRDLVRTQLSRAGEFVASLDQQFEMNEDGKTWTFHISKGIKFHDGSPLTSKDVEASWNKIVFPAEGVLSARLSVFKPLVESIAAPDDFTFVIKLKFAKRVVKNQGDFRIGNGVIGINHYRIFKADTQSGHGAKSFSIIYGHMIPGQNRAVLYRGNMYSLVINRNPGEMIQKPGRIGTGTPAGASQTGIFNPIIFGGKINVKMPGKNCINTILNKYIMQRIRFIISKSIIPEWLMEENHSIIGLFALFQILNHPLNLLTAYL